MELLGGFFIHRFIFFRMGLDCAFDRYFICKPILNRAKIIYSKSICNGDMIERHPGYRRSRP